MDNNMKRNNWFLRIYIGYRNQILIGFEHENWYDGPQNISLYIPFVEIFIQHCNSYQEKKFTWGGIVIE